MSAFMLSTSDIGLLAAVVAHLKTTGGLNDPLPMSPPGTEERPRPGRQIASLTLEEVVVVLAATNAESVGFRYGESFDKAVAGAGSASFAEYVEDALQSARRRVVGKVPPSTIWNVAELYVRQACEGPDWMGSRPYRWVQSVVRFAAVSEPKENKQ